MTVLVVAVDDSSFSSGSCYIRLLYPRAYWDLSRMQSALASGPDLIKSSVHVSAVFPKTIPTNINPLTHVPGKVLEYI